ncbi:MAG: hypothetical protein B6I37_02775 [Desulfobacteraceae bacterium 4572_35.2]|nr:MAG: hypothetical protein B6I37_02775 [Desulfobacteraceae bacterium 4572_35.2]
MRLLPRGKTIKEQLDTSKLKMPDALQKMCANYFSGYLSFEVAQGDGIIGYVKGQIVAALWQRYVGEERRERLCGELALQMIFREIQSDKCLMGVYRLRDDFIPYVRQFCQAKVEARDQLVELLDIHRLMARLKQKQFSGCLRLHSGDRVELIFYSEGVALGFFCDGSLGLSADIDAATSIVLDERCLVDIVRANPAGEQDCRIRGVNLEKVWLRVWRDLNP